MRNYRQPGDILKLTAPTGGVTSGTPVKIGQLVVIPTGDAGAGELFEGMAVGVHSVPKVSGTAWTEGELLYWAAGSSAFSTVASGNTLSGAAVAAAAAADTTGLIRLNGTAAAAS
jgi:predicted RecA/RadA family phage recombinase